MISACSEDSIVLIWNISEQTCLKHALLEMVPHVEMSPDGLCFMCGTAINDALRGWKLFETRSLQCLYTWEPVSGSLFSFSAFSEDSGCVAVTVLSESGLHSLFSSFFLPENSEGRSSVTPSDESRIELGVLEVLDIHHRQKLCTIPLKTTVRGIAFLPDGTSLLVGHEDSYEIFNYMNGGDSGYSSERSGVFQSEIKNALAEVVPDGARFLFIGRSRGSISSSYLVNIDNQPQVIKCIQSSDAFQIIETPGGKELLFLLHDQMGNLYRQGRDSKKYLCWLPPAWRFMDRKNPAVWRGSYLIVGLHNGEIGVIDVEALSYD